MTTYALPGGGSMRVCGRGGGPTDADMKAVEDYRTWLQARAILGCDPEDDSLQDADAADLDEDAILADLRRRSNQ